MPHPKNKRKHWHGKVRQGRSPLCTYVYVQMHHFIGAYGGTRDIVKCQCFEGFCEGSNTPHPNEIE